MNQKNIALITGIAYVLVFAISIVGNGLFLEKVLDKGNWLETYQNIVEFPLTFRIGISSWFLVIICDIIAAWGIYLLFKSTNRELALLTAWMRIIFATIYAIGFLQLFELSTLIHDNIYIESFTQNQLVTLTMLAIKNYNSYVNLSFLIFGIHIGLLSYLILSSKLISKVIGFALIIACVGYLINSFGSFLSKDFANNPYLFLAFVAIPAIISELSLTIFLIIKNKKISQQLQST